MSTSPKDKAIATTSQKTDGNENASQEVQYYYPAIPELGLPARPILSWEEEYPTPPIIRPSPAEAAIIIAKAREIAVTEERFEIAKMFYCLTFQIWDEGPPEEDELFFPASVKELMKLEEGKSKEEVEALYDTIRNGTFAYVDDSPPQDPSSFIDDFDEIEYMNGAYD
ncbi:hypothetical protein BJ508DRAFT_307594 [Ascobolus immersus RN42]|uniref:Uncharacterized protein n=1 Tax=Ascobolus immersus RN42 TaxID=1160509 RepID=A0A3N4I7Q0_ASCIM|nr:hypothetical protein BJ508DRAFT_307594 [Ascobolus immersus RN42]